MNNKLIILFELILIPVLVSLSWILGGNLVKSFGTIDLTIARIGLSGFLLLPLLFFSFNKSTILNLKNMKSANWWFNQIILTITGRVLYFILSTNALKTITPLQAIMFNSLLPIFGIGLSAFIGEKYKNKNVLTMSVFASFFTMLAIFSLVKDSWYLNVGLIEMFFAVFFFSLHIVLYKKLIINEGAVQVLCVQFLLCFIFIYPLNFRFYESFKNITNDQLIYFILYTTVCNLLPFFLLHHSLRHVKALNVQLVCTLTPICGIILSFLFGERNISITFIILTLVSILLIGLILFLELRSKQEYKNVT